MIPGLTIAKERIEEINMKQKGISEDNWQYCSKNYN